MNSRKGPWDAHGFFHQIRDVATQNFAHSDHTSLIFERTYNL